jgi:ethanolamine utilization protein EutN
MFVAKVVGNVWATRKHPILKGKKMLLVQPIDELDGSGKGVVQMAIDSSTGAGIGDTVLILDEGSSCRQIIGEKRGPTRTIIAGIVDSVLKNSHEKKWH